MSDPALVFAERLPLHPWATMDPHYGQRPYPREIAKGFDLIQYNAPASVSWLGYDIDRELAAIDWEDRHAPAPNLIMINEANGHAHLLYGLGVPVHDYLAARPGPLRYLASIDCGLSAKLEADPSYNQRLVKNPLVPTWLVIEPRPSLYDLAELADFIDIDKYARRSLPTAGLGRNCTLFEELRRWAYSARRETWFSAEAFAHAVLTQAQKINSSFPVPLPASEIRATSRSVSRWVWENMSRRSFIALQAARGRQSGIARREKVAERNSAILETILRNPELTHNEVADMFEVSRSTIIRVVKSVSRTISDNTLNCDCIVPLDGLLNEGNSHFDCEKQKNAARLEAIA